MRGEGTVCRAFFGNCSGSGRPGGVRARDSVGSRTFFSDDFRLGVQLFGFKRPALPRFELDGAAVTAGRQQTRTIVLVPRCATRIAKKYYLVLFLVDRCSSDCYI